MDRQAIIEAYEDVRSDQTPTSWALFGFDDSDKIVLICSGNDNSEFLEKIADDQRQFVFVRVTTGDELSKRAKFAFISWIGENVAALKRAKMTQARSLIKEVVKVNKFKKKLLLINT
ncbi:DgyrCDS6319 [Dimorphilus gyrociliatus]|uniref:Coactosin-like protein n=1 Tax=Dimorphilus gyrociliatus TaxID=2664684 RepID=A0A7I8VMW5_9ANNE|nr:DgyrCDS6319 [Dimorphilus gyrociliatus]